MNRSTKLVVLFIMIGLTINAFAQIPQIINFQGALKDADGVPVNDTKYMNFRIYDDPSAGTLLWNENHSTVVITDGLFSAELGGDVSFPAGLFDNAALYLTFFVGGEEMAPRQQLLAVPYAMQADEATHATSADNATTVGSVGIANLVQQDGSGNATITGTMTANAFAGDGSALTGISAAYDDLYVNTTGPDTISATPTLDEAVLNINHQGYNGYGLKITGGDSMESGIMMNNLPGDGIALYYLDGYAYRAIGGYSHFRSHSSDNFGLEIYNSGNHGITMSGISGDGIHIESATGNLFQGGEDGNEVFTVANNGITDITSSPDYMEGVLNINHQGYNGYGIQITTASNMEAGISMSNIDSDGIYLSDLNGYAYRAIGGYSHFRSHSSDNFGLEVYSSGNHGITMSGIGVDGIHIGSAGDDGVYANTTQVSHEWGLYTPDKIYGSNVTMRSQSTHVRYVGNEMLEAGDLVCIAGGYEEDVLDDGFPIINVTKANSRNSSAIIGVVEYKVYIREEIEEHEGETHTEKSFRFAEGSASYGDYLSVVVFGPADVKMDSRADIKVGEKMTVSDNGDARSINDEDNWRIGILGKALEDSNGKDTVKIFVNCK